MSRIRLTAKQKAARVVRSPVRDNDQRRKILRSTTSRVKAKVAIDVSQIAKG